MEVTVNGHQIAPAARVTVLLDADASTADVLAADEFVTKLTGKAASLHYGKAGVVSIVPAPAGPRKAQRRYAHGGHNPRPAKVAA